MAWEELRRLSLVDSFQVANRREAQDWMAGDAVLIAPVSAQIPCKQGILQGNWQFWEAGDTGGSLKPLQNRHFTINSLLELTGNFFQQTG
jgi:hypothetical protein